MNEDEVREAARRILADAIAAGRLPPKVEPEVLQRTALAIRLAARRPQKPQS